MPPTHFWLNLRYVFHKENPMRSRTTHRYQAPRSQTRISKTTRRSVMAFFVTLAVMIVATTVLASISFILKWGSTGSGSGQFLTPAAINTDAVGNVYVAEGNG